MRKWSAFPESAGAEGDLKSQTSVAFYALRFLAPRRKDPRDAQRVAGKQAGEKRLLVEEGYSGELGNLSL